MPLVTNPSHPGPPIFVRTRQIPRQDSQTTLGEEEERYDDQDQMEYDYVRRSTTTGARSSITQRTNHRSWRSIPTPISPSSTPPPVWPVPGSPPLIVANFTPPPSPPPILVKRSTTRAPQPPRPKLWTTTSAAAMLPPLTTAQERKGPPIIQAYLHPRISPDPKKHVFIGPWLNRRGDEWVGITHVPAEYRVKAAKEDKAFHPKFLNYPEEIHLFMNPIGDVMDARTLGMVSKAPRL